MSSPPATSTQKDSKLEYIIYGVAGLATVIGAGALYLYYTYRKEKSESKGKKKKGKGKTEEKKKKKSSADPDDACSKEVLGEALEAMIAKTKDIVESLGQLEQIIRAQSPSASREDILQFLSQQYNSAATAAKESILQKLAINEYQFSMGLEKYSDDPEISPTVMELKNLEDQVAASGIKINDPEELQRLYDALPAELTLERVTEIFTAMMEKMCEAMEHSITEAKEENVPTSELDNKIKQKYMEKVDVVRDAILQKYGIDEQNLDLAMQKYQSNPEFARTVAMLQHQQQLRFQNLKARYLT